MVMVFTWISFVLMLVSEVINCAGDDKQKLYAQIIVSQESDFDFSGYIPAIKLALKLINDERSGILPNYTLEHTEIINSKVKLTNCYIRGHNEKFIAVGIIRKYCFR